MNQKKKEMYLKALHNCVSVATGCTEPVAVAYAVATCAEKLNHEEPLCINVKVSANIMKNAIAVVVPGTGKAGLPIAAALGYLFGDPSKGMKVIPKLTADQNSQVASLAASGKVKVSLADVKDKFYVQATVTTVNKHSAEVDIAAGHTNIYLIKKNGETLFEKQRPAVDSLNDWELFMQKGKLQEIWDLCTTLPLSDLQFIKVAKDDNMALAKEGLSNDYGMKVGQAMNNPQGLSYNNSLANKATAYTAAASDARMGGASLPAVTNSGSGNQGITATVPVCVVAEEKNVDEEQLIRALALSHLTAIYIHSFLPILSAYCATHSAAMGAATGISYLLGGNVDMAGRAIKNMIGDALGMVCDGAGCSCAIKVATSVQTMFKAVNLAMQGITIPGTNGMVCDSVDRTIRNLGELTMDGLAASDPVILKIMMSKKKDDCSKISTSLSN